jgi:hypothetical protein
MQYVQPTGGNLSHMTNMTKQKIKNDPGSEEVQGKNLVSACVNAGVQCFIWSSLPSSAQISSGRLVSKIYEGKLSCRKTQFGSDASCF